MKAPNDSNAYEPEQYIKMFIIKNADFFKVFLALVDRGLTQPTRSRMALDAIDGGGFILGPKNGNGDYLFKKNISYLHLGLKHPECGQEWSDYLHELKA